MQTRKEGVSTRARRHIHFMACDTRAEIDSEYHFLKYMNFPFMKLVSRNISVERDAVKLMVATKLTHTRCGQVERLDRHQNFITSNESTQTFPSLDIKHHNQYFKHCLLSQISLKKELNSHN